MSNSTVEVYADGPVKAPARAPALVPAPVPVQTPGHFGPPAPLPVGNLPPQSAIGISWVGIVGILAAFLVLAVIALIFFWYKKNAYKKALQDQRNFYVANAVSQIREEWSDDDVNRSKRGQTTLADFEHALVAQTRSKRFNWGNNAAFGDSPSGERIVEQDIPICTRAKPSSRGSKDWVLSGSFSDKHMTGSFGSSQCDDLVGEVFYTGVEGSEPNGSAVQQSRIGRHRDFNQNTAKPEDSEDAEEMEV